MKRLDCIIASLPFIEFYLPPAAPAVLKGHLETKGFTVQTLDLNITVKQKFENNDLGTASAFFHTNHGKVEFNETLLKDIDDLIESWVDTLLDYNPRFIGLSVFSIDSRKACELLTAKLKNRQHDCKVFIGGMGVEEDWLDTVKPNIDFYIMGEGELACENLLKGNYKFPQKYSQF